MGPRTESIVKVGRWRIQLRSLRLLQCDPPKHRIDAQQAHINQSRIIVYSLLCSLLNSSIFSLAHRNSRQILFSNRNIDGLRVAAPVARLVQLSGKIISLVSTVVDASRTARSMLAKVNTLQAIIYQLQDFILDFDERTDDRRSMI